MSSNRAEKEKNRLVQDKCQQILAELLRDDDNKYCVDCDAKGPRWASWNLGIFLCIRCAGIHRNLGVHISKVKSINLDAWTPEQVAYLQQMGNSKARAVYEANLPDNFGRPQTDTGLETFVRAKYEQKKYIAKEWVPPPPPSPAFNIEEERRKERENKRVKAIRIPNSGPIVETNPVPRPHSTFAGTTINADKVPIEKNGLNKASIDLLGLELSPKTVEANVPKVGKADEIEEDLFDAFVSAPVTAKAGKEENSDESNEDFFNQKAPVNKKLDKEEILKLYGNTNTIHNINGGFINMGLNHNQTSPLFFPSNNNILASNLQTQQPYFSPPTNPFLASNTLPFTQMQQSMSSLHLGGNIASNWTNELKKVDNTTMSPLQVGGNVGPNWTSEPLKVANNSTSPMINPFISGGQMDGRVNLFTSRENPGYMNGIVAGSNVWQ